ncbi:MAG TPA: 30S ribosomal protein S16 [Thiothrix sp.]|nr:30S ribosomal protein S16 [Thiothrix sp.]
MISIRLARGGSKKRPFYHIVVSDVRKPRDSGYVERLGYFNPGARGKEVRLHLESDRAAYWLAQGAQPTDRVKHLLKVAKKNAATAAASADTSTAATTEAASAE